MKWFMYTKKHMKAEIVQLRISNNSLAHANDLFINALHEKNLDLEQMQRKRENLLKRIDELELLVNNGQTIQYRITEITDWGKRKGWEFREENIGEKLLLVCSELTEAFEEWRNGHGLNEVYYSDDAKPEGFGIEIADAIIRLFHICGSFHIDLEEMMKIKMMYNENRPYRHGGKKA